MKGGGGVYFEAPRGRTFKTPPPRPPLHTPAPLEGHFQAAWLEPATWGGRGGDPGGSPCQHRTTACLAMEAYQCATLVSSPGHYHYVILMVLVILILRILIQSCSAIMTGMIQRKAVSLWGRQIDFQGKLPAFSYQGPGRFCEIGSARWGGHRRWPRHRGLPWSSIQWQQQQQLPLWQPYPHQLQAIPNTPLGAGTPAARQKSRASYC